MVPEPLCIATVDEEDGGRRTGDRLDDDAGGGTERTALNSAIAAAFVITLFVLFVARLSEAAGPTGLMVAAVEEGAGGRVIVNVTVTGERTTGGFKPNVDGVAAFAEEVEADGVCDIGIVTGAEIEECGELELSCSKSVSLPAERLIYVKFRAAAASLFARGASLKLTPELRKRR